jgi:hypothetical protein
VRHGGAKRASEAVPTKAEARMLEAKLRLEMGSQATGFPSKTGRPPT